MRPKDTMTEIYALSIEGTIIYLRYKEKPADATEDVMVAEMIKKEFEDLLQTHSHDTQYDLFVDVSKTKGWNHIPQKSRAAYATLVGHRYIRRVAVYGNNALLGLAGSLIAQLSGKGDALHFFDSREEAMRWLNEGSG